MSERIVFKSPIGTHRLRSKKTPRILFPYYQNYKPTYRGRNSRTPKWCWPDVDKYPYHTHQKRFPSKSDINIEFFAQFANRSEKIRTLFELLHTLPNYGVDSVVYKKRVMPEASGYTFPTTIDTFTDFIEKKEESNDLEEPDKIINENKKETSQIKLNIGNNTYLINDRVQNDLFYHIKQVKYKIRPFKAKITSDMYYKDKLIKKDITPNGAIRGIWKYSHPLSNELNRHLYRPIVPPCYSELIIGR